MPYIYKITSPTGKVYVGSTINVQQRWKKYYNSAREAGRLLGIKSILLILSGHKKNNTSLIYA